MLISCPVQHTLWNHAGTFSLHFSWLASRCIPCISGSSTVHCQGILLWPPPFFLFLVMKCVFHDCFTSSFWIHEHSTSSFVFCCNYAYILLLTLGLIISARKFSEKFQLSKLWFSFLQIRKFHINTSNISTLHSLDISYSFVHQGTATENVHLDIKTKWSLHFVTKTFPHSAHGLVCTFPFFFCVLFCLFF